MKLKEVTRMKKGITSNESVSELQTSLLLGCGGETFLVLFDEIHVDLKK